MKVELCKKNNKNITVELNSHPTSTHSPSQSGKVLEERILPKYREELSLLVGRPDGACCHGQPR